jgi:hypothetical protein
VCGGKGEGGAFRINALTHFALRTFTFCALSHLRNPGEAVADAGSLEVGVEKKTSFRLRKGVSVTLSLSLTPHKHTQSHLRCHIHNHPLTHSLTHPTLTHSLHSLNPPPFPPPPRNACVTLSPAPHTLTLSPTPPQNFHSSTPHFSLSNPPPHSLTPPTHIHTTHAHTRTHRHT